MGNETYSSIVWGAIFFALLLFVIVYDRRRRRTKRRLIMQLFKRYFDGEISADQFDQRTREIANQAFTQSAKFHSLTVAGFQCAVDAKLLKSAYSNQEEKKLLSLLAALKKKYGLTDLYRLETWRSGRE